MESEVEQAAFADPGEGTSSSGRGFTQLFLSDLGTGTECEPGGECHTYQESLEVFQVGNLSLFPAPSEGFVVSKGGFDGIASAIAVDQAPTGG